MLVQKWTIVDIRLHRPPHAPTHPLVPPQAKTESGELQIHQLLELILELRGDHPTTVKDLIQSQGYTFWKISRHIDQQLATSREAHNHQLNHQTRVLESPWQHFATKGTRTSC